MTHFKTSPILLRACLASDFTPPFTMLIVVGSKPICPERYTWMSHIRLRSSGMVYCRNYSFAYFSYRLINHDRLVIRSDGSRGLLGVDYHATDYVRHCGTGEWENKVQVYKWNLGSWARGGTYDECYNEHTAKTCTLVERRTTPSMNFVAHQM